MLFLDTGNDSTLIMNTQFRAVAGLGQNGPEASEVKGWGVNGEFRGDAVPISSIDIENGNVRLEGSEETRIVIGRRGSFSKVHWWQLGIGEKRMINDGAIGNGFLERLTWTFDPAAKRIYVEVVASDSASKTH